MNRVFKLLVLAGCLILLASCGSKKSPTGGPQDTEKPVVLTSMPSQFSQITDGRIEINFSKSLDRSSVAQAVYIYPPVADKKITVDKSTLLIRLYDELIPDTNYYVTLSTRLKDLRGNALAENQTLVFASGKLNTLRLAGSVFHEDAADRDLPLQLLLLSSDSLMVINQASKGETYAIEALNPASYILRAYIDKNQNGRYDLTREPYFESKPELWQSANLDISLSYADTSLVVLRTAVAKSNREIELTFSEPVASFGSVRLLRLDNQQELPILLSKISRDKLTLLTQAQDAQAYTVEVRQLKDAKGNTTPISKLEFRSSLVYDTTPPTVTFSNPRNGTSVSSLEPTLEVHFSEIIPAANLKATLKTSETNTEIPLDIIQSNSDVYRFKPRQALQNYRSHVLVITASDFSGNKMTEEYKLNILPLIRSN